MLIGLAYALGGSPGGGQQPNMLATLFPFILVFAVIYFIMIRPQRKRQEEHKRMLASVRKGDRVITTGGIHGMVTKIRDDVL
ncbi:MAG: preprotein translocase subunit YajC, partial [Nitrospinota bacterium]